MSDPNAPTRAICLRETDDNFYVAVSSPYLEHEANYQRLAHLASEVSVHTLDEDGSQVFVYPRTALYPLTVKVRGTDAKTGREKDIDIPVTDEELLLHRVKTADLYMAGVVVDYEIEEIKKTDNKSATK